MAEARTHIDQVRPGIPLRLGAITVLPIERLVLDAGLVRGHPWLMARKHVQTLIVRDAQGTWALDAEALPVPLETLRQQLPDLDGWLARL